MRKILLGLLAVVLFASCEDKTGYTITGTFPDVADGTEVFLSSERRGKDIVETTTVKDGKFTFSGTRPEAIVRFLKVDGHNNFRRPHAIVVEGGNIQVSVVDGSTSVVGTALNNSYTKLVADIASKKAGVEDVKKFVNENISNILGVTLFEANVSQFKLEELKETYAKVSDTHKQLAIMQRIGKGITAREATAIRVKFTDLKGNDPEGRSVALSDYAGKGKVVLVDFWASWCPYCIAEMPDLVAAYDKYKDKGFEIVGVSLDDKNDLWKAGIEKSNATWAHISDLKGWESELSKAYAIFSLPQTVLIDKDGIIIDKQVRGADLDAKLAEIFK